MVGLVELSPSMHQSTDPESTYNRAVEVSAVGGGGYMAFGYTLAGLTQK